MVQDIGVVLLLGSLGFAVIGVGVVRSPSRRGVARHHEVHPRCSAARRGANPLWRGVPASASTASPVQLLVVTMTRSPRAVRTRGSPVAMRWFSRARHWCWGFSPFWFEQRGGAVQGAEEQCAQGQEGLAAAALVPSPSSFPSFSPFLNTAGDEFGGNPHMPCSFGLSATSQQYFSLRTN
jgi:hypothetical protein